MKFEADQISVEPNEGKIQISQWKPDEQYDNGKYDELSITPEQAEMFCKWVLKVAAELRGVDEFPITDEELSRRLNGHRLN